MSNKPIWDCQIECIDVKLRLDYNIYTIKALRFLLNVNCINCFFSIISKWSVVDSALAVI